MKNIEHTIMVRQPLYSSYHKFFIDTGASFNLPELKENHDLVKFLVEEHHNNPYIIVGNIGELYRIHDEILKQETIGRMTYREHLQELIQQKIKTTSDE